MSPAGGVSDEVAGRQAMEIECYGCGSTVFAMEGFARETRHGTRYSGLLCGPCHRTSARWWMVAGLVGLVALCAVFVAFITWRFGVDGLGLLFLPGAALLVGVISAGGVALEALVAWLVRLRLLGIVFGTGAPAFRTMLRAVVLVTAWVPFGGVVNVATLQPGGYRTRRFVAGLAAPAFGLVVLLVALGVESEHGAAGNLRSAVLLASGVQILTCLLMPPSRVGQLVAGHQYLPRHFLTIPFMRRSAVRADLCSGAIELALRASLRGDAGLTARAVEVAVEFADDGVRTQALLIDPLIIVGEFEEAGRLARACLDGTAVGDAETARYLAMVTWCSVLLDREAMAWDQGRSARAAFELRPWDPLALGAHGAVLVEQGQIEEGLTHLIDAGERAEAGMVRTFVFSEIALARARRGERDLAAAALVAAEEPGLEWPRLTGARSLVHGPPGGVSR